MILLVPRSHIARLSACVLFAVGVALFASIPSLVTSASSAPTSRTNAATPIPASMVFAPAPREQSCGCSNYCNEPYPSCYYEPPGVGYCDIVGPANSCYGCGPGENLENGCWCTYYPSPIVIDLNGDGFKFSNLASGTEFAIGPTALIYRVSWTEPDTDDAWLVLDRNDDDIINDGTELFGNATPQPASSGKKDEPNGFRALAMFDEPANGGNGDGVIDSSDAVYGRLRLWLDRNHNGTAEARELERLEARGVQGISLKYAESKFVDQFGNAFRYRAKILDSKNAAVGKWAYDVFLRATRTLQ